MKKTIKYRNIPTAVNRNREAFQNESGLQSLVVQSSFEINVAGLVSPANTGLRHSPPRRPLHKNGAKSRKWEEKRNGEKGGAGDDGKSEKKGSLSHTMLSKWRPNFEGDWEQVKKVLFPSHPPRAPCYFTLSRP